MFHKLTRALAGLLFRMEILGSSGFSYGRQVGNSTVLPPPTGAPAVRLVSCNELGALPSLPRVLIDIAKAHRTMDFGHGDTLVSN
jgi:hypothetical protein